MFILGGVRETWKYEQEQPTQHVVDDGNAIDLTNKTTLDDCIEIFCNTRNGGLAVGGSTGLLHIASRCGMDHLVWGVEKNVVRYAETNWFGAANQVHHEWGWEPEPEQILECIDAYFAKEDMA